MKLEIEKLDEIDVFFSTEPVSEEQHQAFSAFLQKRKLQRAKRSAVLAMRKNSTSAAKRQ